MVKGIIRKESADGGATDQGAAAGHTWNEIVNEASKLSHVVQSGRYVTKDQLHQVDREIHGPGGYLKK
jgi:hypothetical protein